MSEFKGTKSKWIIEFSDRDYSYDVYNESKDEFVCTTMGSLETEKYNALLISKAPEMLDMLKRIAYGENAPNILEIRELIKEATEINKQKAMNKIERIKQLNENRKFFKTKETDFYDWNEPEKYQESRKQRMKIEKQIFNLIEQL